MQTSANAQHAESEDISDADLVAGLSGLSDDAADPDADEADADAEDADKAESDGDAEDVDAEADADEGDEEADDADPDDEESDEDDDEDEEPAGLAQVRKAEQRMRAKLDAERAELEQAKAKHAEDVKAVQEFRDLAKRARYDRVGVLRALGVTPDQFADISREFWAHSEEGAKDPKLKDAIAKTAK